MTIGNGLNINNRISSMLCCYFWFARLDLLGCIPA